MTSTIANKYVTVGNLEHYTETFTTNVLNAALNTYAAAFGASLSINGTSLSLVNSSGTALNSVTIPTTTSLAWSAITSKPETFTPSSHTHGSNDITGLDAAKITSGTIDLDRLPQGALDRLVKVADQAARFALTTASVQNGDSVQQLDTELMYRVVDDTKLNSEDGYVKYTADRASAVPWSGVTDKPQTFTPSNHTHAGSDITSSVENATNADKVKCSNLTSGTVVPLGIFTDSPDNSYDDVKALVNDVRVQRWINTSNNQGFSIVKIGNNKSIGTDGNSTAALHLYGSGANHMTIDMGTIANDNKGIVINSPLTEQRTYTLPNESGTIALTSSDITGSSASCTGNATTATTASACSGNAASATYATNVRITPSDGTTAYPVTMLNGSTASTNYALRTAVNNTTVANSGLKCIPGADVAANTEGTTTLVIGNDLAKSAADNRTGNIRMHGNSSGYTTVKPGFNGTGYVTVTLPAIAGRVIVSSDSTPVVDIKVVTSLPSSPITNTIYLVK